MDSRLIIDANIFIEEAKKIGDIIIHTAIKEERGWYWNIHDHYQKIENPKIIYNGSSGIILYLIELYKMTKDERYYNAIVQGTNWLMEYNINEGERNLAFYCGTGGIIYTLIEVYKITGNQLYKHYALRLTRECNHPNHNSDILYGTASSILTLLHLHNETNEEWLLEIITQKVISLLDESLITPAGICWERNGSSIHPICGFAHGGAGIAFAFLELYRYFKNEIFLDIAEMAFEYEDQYFEKNSDDIYSKYNWPDLRKNTYDEKGMSELIDAYSSNNVIKFVSFSYMSAWCHGAPGIGMARLHAYNITKKEKHLKYSNYALENTLSVINTKNSNFTLCHGTLGNANLLLDAYVSMNNALLYEIAAKEGNNSIANKNEHGFFISGIAKNGEQADCDLLNGIAGIGHYYLRLIDPVNVTSVLIPSLKEIKTNVTPLAGYDYVYLLNLMFRKIFPNTSLLFIPTEELINEHKEHKISKDRIIKTTKKIVNEKNDVAINNSFNLDSIIITLSDNVKSDNYFYIKDYIEKRAFNEIEFDKVELQDLFKHELILNSTITLQKQVYQSYTAYTILQISPISDPINQYTVSKFIFDLLNSFNGSNSLENSYNLVRNEHYNSTNNIANFNLAYKTQLKNCVKTGFLIFIDQYQKENRVFS